MWCHFLTVMVMDSVPLKQQAITNSSFYTLPLSLHLWTAIERRLRDWCYCTWIIQNLYSETDKIATPNIFLVLSSLLCLVMVTFTIPILAWWLAESRTIDDKSYWINETNGFGFIIIWSCDQTLKQALCDSGNLELFIQPHWVLTSIQKEKMKIKWGEKKQTEESRRINGREEERKSCAWR